MIDEKVITEATEDFLKFDSALCFPSRINFRKGFKDGVHWTENYLRAEYTHKRSYLARQILDNFFDSLWHKGEEKPKLYNKWIIFKYDNFDYVSTYQVRKYGDWVNMTKGWPSFHWMYVDDFLPKEEGEE